MLFYRKNELIKDSIIWEILNKEGNEKMKGFTKPIREQFSTTETIPLKI
jgi:hypothetical protein